MTPTLVWRFTGGSQVALALAHIIFWRRFEWSRELKQLTPLTARVFAVHTFFVAFVVGILGALELVRPELLEARGELARLLLGGATLFWSLRLLAQGFVFDAVMLPASRWRTPLRIAAWSLFASYTAVYALAWVRQQ